MRGATPLILQCSWVVNLRYTANYPGDIVPATFAEMLTSPTQTGSDHSINNWSGTGLFDVIDPMVHIKGRRTIASAKSYLFPRHSPGRPLAKRQPFSTKAGAAGTRKRKGQCTCARPRDGMRAGSIGIHKSAMGCGSLRRLTAHDVAASKGTAACSIGVDHEMAVGTLIP